MRDGRRYVSDTRCTCGVGRAIAKVKLPNYSFPTRGDRPALLPSNRMPTLLETPKRVTPIVADTGDIAAIARHRPRDATTNPPLGLKAAQGAQNAPPTRAATADGYGGPVELRPMAGPARWAVARC
jgi:hypothetical protein